MNLNNKKILILGMGREGQATEKYLRTFYSNCEISTADKNDPQNYPDSLGEWDVVFVTPGMPPSDPLLKTAREVMTATNLFLEDCKGRVVAVTGSKGKSTTSSLIHAMVPGSYLVGNIGVPGLEILREHNESGAVYVFEMSSAQASRLVKGPEVAVILNLFPEHLDYHGSVEEYYAAKMQITLTQTAENTVIYNAGWFELVARIGESRAKKLTWKNVLIPDVKFALLGEHNRENIKAAIKAARVMGATDEEIATGLQEFKPLPHRLEFVGEFDGVKFFNDSISTAPEATMAAIDALGGRGAVSTLLLGGFDRGYDFTELGEDIVLNQVQNVVLSPETGARIKEALKLAGFTGEILETKSMEEAVKWARVKSAPGTSCALSPGSPSYNLYKNFEERGEAFKRALKFHDR